jgi:hypothetical protein
LQNQYQLHLDSKTHQASERGAVWLWECHPQLTLTSGTSTYIDWFEMYIFFYDYRKWIIILINDDAFTVYIYTDMTLYLTHFMIICLPLVDKILWFLSASNAIMFYHEKHFSTFGGRTRFISHTSHPHLEYYFCNIWCFG